MSIHDNERQEKRDAKRAKRSEPAPWASQDKGPSDQAWEEVDPLLIAYVVQAVSAAGGSAQFTVARDGGALGIRIYDDGHKPVTEWERVDSGLEELLYRIADHFQERVGKEARRWS